MTTTGGLLLVSSALYCGFQWTIRVVVYPQFSSVPDTAFPAYERRHQDRVSLAVGPLFAFFGVAAVLAVVIRPDAWTIIATACYAAILLVTGLAAVPLHRRLSSGFEPAAHRRLLRVDAVRLVLAAVAVVAAAVFAFGG
ncbi:hypothetical protein [Jatrophihabitans endophyticus]|uniref:hypothetical protein n=1 Tax=Jatrophihabitans endophyticus TaxID=1206085 RepID=UPI0026EFFE21|nr:hypothetical protein [Jatrophihabitans endophyticus]